MHSFNITIKNYRCFDRTAPVTVELGPDIIAFVGPNNSGKSSLLRMFYELRPLLGHLSVPENCASMVQGGEARIEFQEVEDQQAPFSFDNDGDMSLEVQLLRPPPDTCEKLTIRTTGRGSSTWKGGGSEPFQNVGWEGTRAVLPDRKIDFGPLSGVFRELQGAMYVGSFRNAINSGSASYYDLSVGTQFVQEWNLWKNGGDKRKSSRIQEVNADLQRIFGFRSLEINASNDRLTLQVFVDGKPHRLAELGAGLAQFIVTFGAAATKEPSIILVDEPELSLHPSLQLDFVTSLAKYARHGLWFATHSIGLARSVADRVYSLQRRDGRALVRLLEGTPNYPEFLGEMSFSAYRELGFDRVLLVEGPSEIRTIQQWLRLYGKEHRVVPIHLGGGSTIKENPVGLEELKRITPNIAVLIDSERHTPDEELERPRAGFLKHCQALGFHAHATARRATENYLTKDAIQAVKGEKYRALGPHEALMQAPLRWGKHENWLIAARMTLADLDATDLGAFLEKL